MYLITNVFNDDAENNETLNKKNEQLCDENKALKELRQGVLDIAVCKWESRNLATSKDQTIRQCIPLTLRKHFTQEELDEIAK